MSQSKISASGTSTISINYAPASSDKSSKIVLIQVLQQSLDGVKVKPSQVQSSWAYRDADTTTDFWYVDYLKGEKDPYYNGDDPADVGHQGNATSTPPVPSTMTDTPDMPDTVYPAGKTTVFWQFRTASFSAAGADQGTFYDYVDWTYSKEKGKSSAIKIGSTGSGNPGAQFQAALNLWCKNHGFALPSAAAAPQPAPAPAPTPAPAPAPAPGPAPKP